MQRTDCLGRLAITLILAAAIAPLWMIAAETLYSAAESSGEKRFLFFTHEGTPILVCQAGEATRYEDLAGKALDYEDTGDEPQRRFLLGPANWRRAKPSRNWSNRISVFPDGHNPEALWSLVSDGQPDGRAYLVGYDSLTKTRLGFLGVDEFRLDQPTVDECFPFMGGEIGAGGAHSNIIAIDLSYRGSELAPGRPFPAPERGSTAFDVACLYLIGSDHHLRRVDLRHRTAEIVANELNVVSGETYYVSHTGRRNESWLALRTDREIVLLDNRNRIGRRYAIPAEAPDGEFTWGEIAPGRAIVSWNVPNSAIGARVTHALWFDQTGNVTRRETVTLPGRQYLPLHRAALAPSPVELGALLRFAAMEVLTAGAGSWNEAYAIVWDRSRPDTAVVLILAALLAAVCYRREARYAASPWERVLWPLLVLIGGVPVWLGYRFSRRWPPLEICPTCHARVPRDRVPCARCGSDFPRPEPLGTEVLSA